MARVTPTPTQYANISSADCVYNPLYETYELKSAFKPGINTDTLECISCSLQATMGVLCAHALLFHYFVGGTSTRATLDSYLPTRASLVTELNIATAGAITWVLLTETILDSTFYRLQATNISGSVITIPPSSPFIRFGSSCHGYRDTQNDITIAIAGVYVFPVGSFTASYEYYLSSRDFENVSSVYNASYTPPGLFAIVQPGNGGATQSSSYHQSLVMNLREEYDAEITSISLTCGCGSNMNLVTMDESHPFFKAYFLIRGKERSV